MKMTMDQAAVFLAGSVLTALGFLVILGTILVANNLVAKYWKSWGWKMWPMTLEDQPRFMTHEEAEKIAPIMETKNDRENLGSKP